MKLFILSFMILFLVGCSTKLPDGYKFLCSLDGRVTFKHPDGMIDANVWKTKHAAASFARYWEKDQKEPWIAPSSKYEWEECK